MAILCRRSLSDVCHDQNVWLSAVSRGFYTIPRSAFTPSLLSSQKSFPRTRFQFDSTRIKSSRRSIDYRRWYRLCTIVNNTRNDATVTSIILAYIPKSVQFVGASFCVFVVSPAEQFFFFLFLLLLTFFNYPYYFTESDRDVYITLSLRLSKSSVISSPHSWS